MKRIITLAIILGAAFGWSVGSAIAQDEPKPFGNLYKPMLQSGNTNAGIDALWKTIVEYGEGRAYSQESFVSELVSNNGLADLRTRGDAEDVRELRRIMDRFPNGREIFDGFLPLLEEQTETGFNSRNVEVEVGIPSVGAGE